jgi:hypothetical protein
MSPFPFAFSVWRERSTSRASPATEKDNSLNRKARKERKGKRIFNDFFLCAPGELCGSIFWSAGQEILCRIQRI